MVLVDNVEGEAIAEDVWPSTTEADAELVSNDGTGVLGGST